MEVVVKSITALTAGPFTSLASIALFPTESLVVFLSLDREAQSGAKNPI